MTLPDATLQRPPVREHKDAGSRQGPENGSQRREASVLLSILYFCFIDYAKAFDCVDHNKLWKILKDMGIPDHLIYLLRSLYGGQGSTVRTGHS